MFDYVVCTRDKTACIHRRDIVFYDKNLPLDTYEKNPVCLAMFRSYSEADLIELNRVSKIIKDKKKFDYIDINTILGMYEGHTIFSIFHDNEKFHEQVLR